MSDRKFVETWPKKCACGHQISEEGWEDLRYVGVQRSGFDDSPDLELRNCSACGSTIAIAVPSDFSS
jgi:hypothetical protein